MEKYDRYLRIVNWARNRYTVSNALIVSIGGAPSRYTMIEKLAAHKLLGCVIN